MKEENISLDGVLKTENNWNPIGGLVTNISVGADGLVMGVNAGGGLYQYISNSWVHLEDGFSKISVGNGEHIWGVLKNGNAVRYLRKGFLKHYKDYNFTSISVGEDGEVWALVNYDDSDGDAIYQFDHPTDSWILKIGLLTQISVANENQIWGVNGPGDLFKFDIYNNTFQKHTTPDALTDISVGANETLYGISRKGVLYRHIPNTTNWENGWISVDVSGIGADSNGKNAGILEQISIGNPQHVFGIQKTGEIYQYNAKAISKLTGEYSIRPHLVAGIVSPMIIFGDGSLDLGGKKFIPSFDASSNTIFVPSFESQKDDNAFEFQFSQLPGKQIQLSGKQYGDGYTSLITGEMKEALPSGSKIIADITSTILGTGAKIAMCTPNGDYIKIDIFGFLSATAFREDAAIFEVERIKINGNYISLKYEGKYVRNTTILNQPYAVLSQPSDSRKICGFGLDLKENGSMIISERYPDYKNTWSLKPEGLIICQKFQKNDFSEEFNIHIFQPNTAAFIDQLTIESIDIELSNACVLARAQFAVHAISGFITVIGLGNYQTNDNHSLEDVLSLIHI